MPFTVQQQKAINAPLDRSVIVTAAAGSGKTTLLIERIVRLLSDVNLGIRADSLAIMTFTRNAASGLKSKLIAKLSAKQKELAATNTPEADETRQYLSDQLFLLRSASIGTIDSFCINVLKENAQVFDLPMKFSIADTTQKVSMQTLAMDLTMKFFYEKGENEIADKNEISAKERADLFYTFSFEDDRALQEAIVNISEKLSSYADSEKWLDDCVDSYKDIKSLEDRYLGIYSRNLIKLIKKTKDEATLVLQRCIELKSLYDDYVSEFAAKMSEKKSDADKLKKLNEVRDSLGKINDNNTQFMEAVTKYYEQLAANPSIETLNRFTSVITELGANPVSISKADPQNKLKKEFNECKNSFNEYRENLIKASDFSIESEKETLAAQHDALKTFAKLIKMYTRTFRSIKQKSGCPDFSDCELMLLEKLRENEEFRRQLSDRYSCIIVDEFQDSNDVQAEIFRLISNGKNNMFFVGDVKQAIYTFRGGNPKIMAEMCLVPQKLATLKKNDYKETAIVPFEKGTGHDSLIFSVKTKSRFKNIESLFQSKRRFEVIPLNKNFRSRKTVVDFVNAVFSGLMTKKYGDVDYEQNAKLVFGANELYPPITGDECKPYETEVHMLDRNESQKESSKSTSSDDGENGDVSEPNFVARRIKKLIDDKFQITENGVKRDCKYSDIAILLRAKGKMENYKTALNELNIPSVLPKSGNFLESEEIILIMNILKIIDNPLCDEELLKVMMSPIYDFDAEEMAQIRLGSLGLSDVDSEDLRELAGEMRGRSLYGCATFCARQLYSGKSEVKCENTSEKNAAEDFVPYAAKTEMKLFSAGVRREVSPKLTHFMEQLNDFRAFMSSNSIEALVRKIYDDTELFSIISTYESSKQRLSNVRQLQKYAKDFEEHEGGTLSDFMKFIENTKSFKTRIESISAPEDAGNAVRIMTFHASKGLEMPICIISELDKKSSDIDCKGTYVLSHEYGLALQYVDRKQRYTAKPFGYTAVSAANRNNIYGEELRLLYVAMTRAQEKLILVGKSNKEPNELVMTDGDASTAFTTLIPMNWILASLFRYCGSASFNPDDENEGIKVGKINAAIYRHTADSADNEAVTLSDDSLPAEDNKELTEKIIANLNFKYKYDDDTRRQAKYTVTELAHMQDTAAKSATVYITKPKFLKDGKSDSENKREFTGKEVGDAMHHLMELIPIEEIRRASDSEEMKQIVENTIENLFDRKKITEPEHYILTKAENMNAVEKVVKFFQGSLGQRMLKSDKVVREQPFFAILKGNNLGLCHESEVSLQGRTDMYFYEDGEIVLVDYKTDSPKSLNNELENYAKQLIMYKDILPKTTGRKVKQMYLYGFSQGKEIDVEKDITREKNE